VGIIFESHATTQDNELAQAAGWFDVALSEVGEQQARELGIRRSAEQFDAIFCSDLQRSYKTAELAFGGRFPIFRDARLRECNYGELNQADKRVIETMKPTHITAAYPGGESWQQAAERVADFLVELAKRTDLKRVMIIGHRATQYGVEHYVHHVPVADSATAPWQWQPGWRYELLS
jgi:2,3-bisphosphoglycerate-dependent phosphoglycerate mutase